MKTSTSSIKCFFRLSILIVFILQCLNAQVTDSIHVAAGWNLISLPLKVSDGSKSTLFPTAISDAFIYQDEYLHKDTIENGYGFWLKYNLSETIILTGESIHRDTINVREGWNMIGSLTTSVLVRSILSEPNGIVVSDYFYYNQESGYQSSDTIKPGLGYWVKVSQDGSIILSSIRTTCPVSVEYESKTYNTVKIGSQCWLKENLDVGTMILGNQNPSDNGDIERYCYDDNTTNCDIYGGLYQWYEAMAYSPTPGTRGICPSGWHIPTSAEFQTLSMTVDGNALKAIGQGTGDGAGTNTSGFSALLSGGRDINGFFDFLSEYAKFWSSTENSSTTAVFMLLSSTVSNVYLYYQYGKGHGFSVRCLKD